MFFTIIAAIVIGYLIIRLGGYIYHRLQDPIGKARWIIQQEIEKSKKGSAI